jgi:D-alanyl-D-alanine carboxypeptidase (penicillin-binding protein 5/6)
MKPTAASAFKSMIGRAFLGLSVVAFLAVQFAGEAFAQAEFAAKARQAILMDAESGAVLFAHNADEEMYPASMSKIMTIIMIFKALKAGTLKMSDEFVMSEHAWRTGGAPSRTSAMMVPIHTREPLEQLLQGIIVESGNDACIAVAEGMAGNEAAFAAQMEEEARRLGLKKTTFRNSTGLFHPEHKTTAREMAILARHLIVEYPQFYPMFAQREFKYRKHTFHNRNPLLGLDFGADGIKTGHLKESGFGMIASAKQGNRRLILVINGLDKAEERKNEAVRMLEWGFRTFGDFKLYDTGEVVGEARVWGGSRMFVPLDGGAGSVSVLLPRLPANQRLKAEIIYKSPLKAPIKKGDRVATLRVISSTHAVNEVPLYAAEDVETAGVMRRGLDTIVQMTLGWAL